MDSLLISTVLLFAIHKKIVTTVYLHPSYFLFLFKLLNTFKPVRQLPDSFVSQKFIVSHEAHQYWFLN